MSSSRLPDGVIPPVLTPLTADQKVDVPTFKTLIKQLIDGGSSALFVGGTAGLGSMLTAADYELVVSTALETAPSGYPILCGVLEPSTARALERIKLLESLNAEFFVTVTPYYVKTDEDAALLRHFGSQRDATDMEMVLYNMPGCTGVSIAPPLVKDMVKRGWTNSCKDSSGDNAYFEALCQDSADMSLKVYQGLRPDFAWLQSLGAAGCVPVPANVHPELFSSAWNNRADTAKLPDLQSEIDRVWGELVVGTDYTSRALKQLAQKGFGSGTMALPFD